VEIFPLPINFYYENHLLEMVSNYDSMCKKYKIKGYLYISGDYGFKYPNYENIIYFRMGGFKSKLSLNNKAFPAILSDNYYKLYKTFDLKIREKSKDPLVGFCGLATYSYHLFLYQTLKILYENFKRFLKNHRETSYEPIFQSAFQRKRILRKIVSCDKIKTNFIFRKSYRAGASDKITRRESSIEFYNNITNSDYILCMRGSGNFSIRLFETLMMGRIPIIIDTDCLLPFPNHINWQNHAIIVSWKEKKYLCKKIIEFHSKIKPSKFIQMQVDNRKLWLEKMQPSWVLKNIKEI